MRGENCNRNVNRDELFNMFVPHQERLYKERDLLMKCRRKDGFLDMSIGGIISYLLI